MKGSLFFDMDPSCKIPCHFEPTTGLGQHHVQCDHISPKSQIPEIFHPKNWKPWQQGFHRIGEILWVIVATPFLSKRLSEFSATAHGLTTEKSQIRQRSKGILVAHESGTKTVVWLHLNIPIIHFGFIEILHDSKSNESNNIFQDEKTKQATWRFHLQLFWIVTLCSWNCLEPIKPGDSTTLDPPLQKKNNQKQENTTNTNNTNCIRIHPIQSDEFGSTAHLGQRCQAVGRAGGIGDLAFGWRRKRPGVFSCQKTGKKTNPGEVPLKKKLGREDEKTCWIHFFWGGEDGIAVEVCHCPKNSLLTTWLLCLGVGS